MSSLIACETCHEFDTEVLIHGPGQLRRIVGKLRAAVEAGSLLPNDFESTRALIGQPRFERLDLSTTIPDVIRYYFECSSCHTVFGLVVEAYHGQGGRWGRL